MKKILFLILTGLSISCSSLKQTSSLLGEDELLITRKYVGIYMDYRHTGPDTFSGPNIIWIKTSMDNSMGKISAYGKICEFTPGDRVYLTRKYYTFSGASGYWEYNIENDSAVFYRVTDFQHDHKVLVQNWF